MKTLRSLRQEVAGAQKCWSGYKKTGTQPGTGKNAGKRVNDCEKIEEVELDVSEGLKTIYHKIMAKRAGAKADSAYDMNDEEGFKKQVDKSEYHRVKAGGKPTRINKNPDAKMLTTREEVELDEVSTDGYYKAAVKDRMKQAVKVMGGDESAKTKLDARNAGIKRVEKRTRDDMKKANSGPQRPRPEKKISDSEARGYGQGRYMGDSYEPDNSTQIYEKNKDESPPFDGPYNKNPGTVKDKSGAVHTPMSRAKHLARQAIKQQMKEDIDLFFEAKDEEEYGYEGDMALNQLTTLIRCADMIKELLKPDTDMPEWVQSKITLATDYIQTAADYMYSEMKEEVEQTDESRQSFYINSKNRKNPAVALARKQRRNFRKSPMLSGKNVNLENVSEALSARDRLTMAMNREKKKREDHEAAQAARENANKLAQQTAAPAQKIKEGIASLISNNIKKVTATKPTPQQKADIRLNK